MEWLALSLAMLFGNLDGSTVWHGKASGPFKVLVSAPAVGGELSTSDGTSGIPPNSDVRKTDGTGGIPPN